MEHSLYRGDCQDNLIMTSPGGWLELEEAPVFTKDGRRFAMALSANGYKQVTIMDVCNFFHHLTVPFFRLDFYFYVQVNVVNRDTNQRVPITSGSMVVTNIYHWDEVARSCYVDVVVLIFFSRLPMRSTSRLRKKTLQANGIFIRCQNK